MPATEPTRPRLRVVRGLPDDAELAAVVAALLVVSAAGPSSPVPARSAWAAPGARRDAPRTAGPDAWRLSGLPL
ncbi:acyl-CoA carboxylase epsilon subunit [Amycolatopsis tolypomycina]|uniref:Acyl-CoA carboxylase epsilon subunit n=1 Tax=Amycolatopsis tolypomycina TaxID=208445 RepID=A0A1H4ZYF1_9PSEU|nr:acyl-CoA carboxylase epsilon subunit [Amycolatopsis tolypomycina]SED35216.1 Acyl-CoA carboxylase epsilon subunit [Amycolatopsis tolypomycina]